MSEPERGEQSIGKAASEPPGRRREDVEPPPERERSEDLWSDVPGQQAEPEGEGS